MADINRVFLVGRLTRDAEIKYTTSNLPVCEFSIAVKTAKREGEQWVESTMFLDRISLWGKRAEAIAEYLLKGRLIFLEGRLRMDEWEQEGQKRKALRIVATDVQILSVPKSEAQAPGPAPQPAPEPEEELVEDEDLPF